MDLILWRHAEADDAHPDDARRLTARGHEQAARVAEWLGARLGSGHAVISSPAARCRETAAALDPAHRVDPRLGTGANAADYLAVAGWPGDTDGAARAVVLVGHQPTIGEVASLLLSGEERGWSVRKGAVWWLSARTRKGRTQAVLRTVIGPEQL